MSTLPNTPKNCDPARDRLINWSPLGTDELTRANTDSWYLGDQLNRYPRKHGLHTDGLGSILSGCAPPQPVIDKNTRVIALGSCFARYFILWLAENGFNRNDSFSPHAALIRYGSDFESPAVVAQQFRWALDGLDNEKMLWVTKDKEFLQASEQHRSESRALLQNAEVLVLTLGLSEVWYDQISGEPLWRALPRRLYDPERHVFRIESVEKTKKWLEKIWEIRNLHLKNLKIVFTVSPIPMVATFRPISAVVANSASKAILRAALDEFLREHPDEFNQNLFYFPSYEIAHSYFKDPFVEDNRHVKSLVSATIVRTFVKHFCAESVQNGASQGANTGEDNLDRFLKQSATDHEDLREQEYSLRIVELEEQLLDAQRICRERQEVIDVLDKAARERLDLINQLDKVAKERLNVIEGLQSECARLRTNGKK